MDIEQSINVAEVLNNSLIGNLVHFPHSLHSLCLCDLEKALNSVDQLVKLEITGLNNLKSALTDRLHKLKQTEDIKNNNPSVIKSIDETKTMPRYIFYRYKNRAKGFENCGYGLIVNGKNYLRKSNEFERASILDNGLDFRNNIHSGHWEEISYEAAEQCAKVHYGESYKNIEILLE